MSRFGQDNTDDEDVAIDISPLIDCIFILLIFFIVTTTFVEDIGLEVDKPQASASASDEKKENLVFSVTKEGKVFYNGKDIGVGGVQPIVKRAVEKDEDAPVIIEVAEKAATGPFVRVMDEAKIGGARKLSVSTKKQ